MLSWRNGRIRRWSEAEEQSQAKWHTTLESSHTILPPDDEAEVAVPRERQAQYERAVEIYEELARSLPDPVSPPRDTASTSAPT